MNVVLIAPGVPAEPALCYSALGRALADAGARVHLVTPAGGWAVPAVEARGGLTVHRLSLPDASPGSTRGWLAFSTAAARLVNELATDGGVDVIESPSCGAGALGTLMLGSAAPRRAPAVVTIHDRANGRSALPAGAAGAATRALADLLIAPTSAAMGEDLRLAGGAVVCPYPVTATADSPARRVIAVAATRDSDEARMFEQVWSQVAPQRPGWSRVTLEDQTSPADGAENRGYSLLLDLATDVAGFPYRSAMAMSAGRPLIAAAGSAGAALIGPDADACTFQPDSANELASRLLEWLALGDDELASLGCAARERIATICDPATVARSRLMLYEHAIASIRPGIAGPEQRLAFWRSLRAAAGPGARAEPDSQSEAAA